MVRIVFFDIGDVLFSEDQQHLWLFHTLLLTLRAHGKNVFWDDFDAIRRALVAQGPDPQAAIRGSLAFYCRGEDETEALWQEAMAPYREMRRPRPYGLLLDGVTAVLDDLGRDFRLGVIANQHPPVADALVNYGIAPLFDVIVISEAVGLFKPDPAIYEYALAQAGVAPGEALMVGDRPDNDVRPAKALGMRTVRFRRGVQYVYYSPEGPEYQADETVTDVSDLAAAVRRAAGMGASGT